MNYPELEKRIHALLARQRTAVLATSMGGLPYASLVAFTHSDDLKTILFVTLRDTRKYQNICSEPNVALLIDNRDNAPADLYDAEAVTVIGLVRELTDPAVRMVSIERFLARHPCLDEFIQSPNCAILQVDVSGYRFVTRFQNVFTLEFNS